jgi:hypothetical protein
MPERKQGEGKMQAIVKEFSKQFRVATFLAAAAFAGLVPASTAHADDRRDDHRYDRDRDHDHDRDHGHDKKTDVRVKIDFGGGSSHPETRYEERRTRVWVDPVFRTTRQRVWVEPVFRTETRRIWIAPVTRTVYEEVSVPARFEVRETVSYKNGRKVTTRENFVLAAPRTERVAREVVVTEGRWQTVTEEICVAPGHWETIEREVVVTEGHWDFVVERTEVRERRQDAILDLRF